MSSAPTSSRSRRFQLRTRRSSPVARRGSHLRPRPSCGYGAIRRGWEPARMLKLEAKLTRALVVHTGDKLTTACARLRAECESISGTRYARSTTTATCGSPRLRSACPCRWCQTTRSPAACPVSRSSPSARTEKSHFSSARAAANFRFGGRSHPGQKLSYRMLLRRRGRNEGVGDAGSRSEIRRQ